jgi:hypothetical protein
MSIDVFPNIKHSQFANMHNCMGTCSYKATNDAMMGWKEHAAKIKPWEKPAIKT